MTHKINQLESRLHDNQQDAAFARGRDWSWGDGEDNGDGEMMSVMTNDSPAIFGVPNAKPHPANNSSEKMKNYHYSSQVNIFDHTFVH